MTTLDLYSVQDAAAAKGSMKTSTQLQWSPTQAAALQAGLISSAGHLGLH